MTFAPGEVVQSFQVTVISDGLPGPNKTVNLALNSPQNATLGIFFTAVLTLIDDMPPLQPSVAFSSSSYTVNESAGSATITVTLSSTSTDPVNVYYTTSDGTATAPADYQGASGLLSFAPGEVSKSFTVNFTDDGVPKLSTTVNLALSQPQKATLGSLSTAVLNILDDNTPPASGAVAFAGGDGTATPPLYQVNKAAGTATITVIKGPNSQVVSVNYATSDGTARAPGDYVAASGTLTFPVGTSSRTFTVGLNRSSTTATDVTVNLTLSTPLNAILGNPSTAVLKINEAKPTATIEPATGQAGTTGDVVPSRKAPADGGTKHYVSPKGTDNVVLQANIVGKVKFDDAFQWQGGDAVTGKPDQRQVSRTATGKTTVKIIRNSDSAVMDTMNVWIVWATIAASQLQFGADGDVVYLGGDAIWIKPSAAGCTVMAGYSFTHTIAPAAIIDVAGADVPDLTGANDTPPPDVPAGDGDVLRKGVSLKKGADHKWDNSRGVRAWSINPGNIDFSMNHPAILFASYPNWPSKVGGEDVVGNDDTSANDESNDPYANRGKLTGFDNPSLTTLNKEGANGDTFERRNNFDEFTRLEINRKWYRISDDLTWRITFKFKKAAGKWGDDGSSSARDHAGWSD